MFHQDNNYLFADGDLGATLRARADKMRGFVAGLPKAQFLNTPKEDLGAHVADHFHIEPLCIYEDRMDASQEEAQVDVSGDPMRSGYRRAGPLMIPGLKVAISIPYTGDPILWKLKPSTWRSTFPQANVSKPRADGLGRVSIVIRLPSDQGAEKFKALKDETLDGIRFYLGNQKTEVESFNNKLELLAKSHIDARLDRIKKHDGIVDALGIPLKRDPNAPDLRPISVTKKKIRPLPSPPATGFKPEPGITDSDYDYILNVIRHEGRTFETTPATYALHDEEELRDIMLAHLNGHFEGGATGEAFRRKGKTDIRIEDDERAAFVAECKVWKGAKELRTAADQLLGYLTWRDCKSSLVVVNKKVATFSGLLNKAPDALRSHECFKREIDGFSAGEWRLVFRDPDDESREIAIHLFLFNLYTDRSTTKANKAVQAAARLTSDAH